MSLLDGRPTPDFELLAGLADQPVIRAAHGYRNSVVRLEIASAALLAALEHNDVPSSAGTRGSVRRSQPVEVVGRTAEQAAAYMSALDAKNFADRALTVALARERRHRDGRLRAMLAESGLSSGTTTDRELCLRLQRMAAGEQAPVRPGRTWSSEDVRAAEELSTLVLAHLDGDQAVLDPLSVSDLADGLPLVMVGDFAPRILVGGVVVQHAQWWFAREEIVLADPFRSVQRLRGRYRLPRRCVTGSTENPARLAVDLDVPVLVETMADQLRAGGDLVLAELPAAAPAMVGG